MNIRQIIKEEISNYLKESLIIEKGNKQRKNNTNTKDTVDKAKRRDGHKLSSGDEKQIKNKVLKNGIINVAALARYVYPDHTPEGGQSQLRKHLENEKSDSGSTYHVKEREAGVINKILNNL